jgi:ABC-type branched-subunit amino acid transport system permease subunit
MRVRRTLIAIVPIWAQPTALALLLALVAWPIVAMTWGVGYRGQYLNTPPESALVQWTAAAGGVFLSALVAGSIGGLVVRRNAVAGAIFTFVLALTVAILATTLAPAFLGQENVCDVANIVSPCDAVNAAAQVIIECL